MGNVFIRVNSQETMENQMTKANLTTQQFNAIQESYNVMRNILDSTDDMQDIYLSDIKKLDDAFHKLKFEFNELDENDS